MFSYKTFFVEVHLEKGFLTTILLTFYNQKHVQKLDYEHLPFKCKTYYEYNKSAKVYKNKNPQHHNAINEEQWKSIKKNIGSQSPNPTSLKNTTSLAIPSIQKISISKCHGEKLPMAWGVPQQIAKHEKSILSQYERKTKHLTLRDLESYLIADS